MAVVVFAGNSVSTPAATKKPKMIMHAAGGINDKAYTNSKEALIKSLKRGEKMIELDFMYTKDNYIVCSHNWESTKGKRVTKNKFLKTKINKKYTPMSLDMVIRIIGKYKAKLVVDTKEPSVKKFYNRFMHQIMTTAPAFAKRVVPQLYFDEDYDTVQYYYHFKTMIYTLYKQKMTKDSQYKRIAKFCKKRKIGIVTMPDARATKKHIKIIKNKKLKVAVHTVNDYDRIQELKKNGVRYIYTDFQSSKKLKKIYNPEDEE